MTAHKWVIQETELGNAIWHDEPFAAWRVSVDRHDGERHLFGFPKSTLEWRVAEYGFDPEDIDTLVDVILHEHWADYDDGYPTHLTAKTLKEAREHHLRRIQVVKDTIVHMTPHTDLLRPHPFEIIRKQHNISLARITDKRMIVMDLRGEKPPYYPRTLHGPGTLERLAQVPRRKEIKR